MLAELPRHHIQPKSVWNDKKGRTLVCYQIYEGQNGVYSIELLILGGKKPIEFVTVPWAEVWRQISNKSMQRAII